MIFPEISSTPTTTYSAMSNNLIPVYPNISILRDNRVEKHIRSDRENMLLGMQKDKCVNSGLSKYSGLVETSKDKTIISVAQERKPLSEVLDDITMFRYGYVPFVIAELAWDYADTVIDMSIMCNNPKTKKLSRAVRELRRGYEKYRAMIVSKDGKENEENNMYDFESEVSKIFSLYITNLKCDLVSKYSHIEENTMHLLVSVYQCLLVVKSLLRYSAIQTAKAQEMAGYPVDDVMPKCMHSLATLIVEFAGDMPISDEFMNQQETYIKTITTQIGLIELNLLEE